MTKKSKGITIRKGNKGKSQTVQCDSCGRVTPRGKTIRFKKFSIPLDPDTQRVLRKMRARVYYGKVIVSYCISCARHRHII